ncbi:pyrimidine/purine nucleoside phosphorylase [Paraferrimonas sp. SM1919]|uniref:pyrimidine/purine nucleoside phosphorylase n=1 Tax=Paraferrimonas sp. SM1919 TaxID=2662263 RepID=UPI0013D1BD16|nr:pyrimidine/purine nucleoside phosphorylase [Paraferrimonas sp. SM1919]
MFTKVSVSKISQLYFEGKVSSRQIDLGDGQKRTLGVMQQGQYRFSTNEAEVMTILSGEVEVKLAGENQFTPYKYDQEFHVPSNSYFDIKVLQVTDYICRYIG